MVASKLQRQHSVHYGTTIKVEYWWVGIGIWLSTQATAITQDCLRTIMGHVEGFDWWHRIGVICACDHKVLIGYDSNVALRKHVIPSQPT